MKSSDIVTLMEESLILVGKVYIHYKGGRYFIVGISEESTNVRAGIISVVYLSLAYGKLHHREITEFLEEVEWLDGIRRSRFMPETTQ